MAVMTRPMFQSVDSAVRVDAALEAVACIGTQTMTACTLSNPLGFVVQWSVAVGCGFLFGIHWGWGSREPARPGDFKEHLAELHTGLIEAEAQRIVTDMKRLAAPNSPDKNHFMVEVSPYFTKLASSRDTDQLLIQRTGRCLPYE